MTKSYSEKPYVAQPMLPKMTNEPPIGFRNGRMKWMQNLDKSNCLELQVFLFFSTQTHKSTQERQLSMNKHIWVLWTNQIKLKTRDDLFS